MRISDAEMAELELRANAERAAATAGIANHPWHGAQQQLSDAQAMNKALDESQAADAFAKAVAHYRSLLREEKALTESNAAAEENCLKCADGQAQLRRYTDFLGSMYGKEWMLDRRQRMATELPPGFSQQDFDRIEAFKAAESERQQAAMQMQSVLSQLAVLEEVHPVLRDLRAFASEPEAMVTA